MAFQPDNQDLRTQNAQLREMFLNLSQGQEEIKTLLTRNLTLGNAGGIRNDQLEGLQIELATMKIQMMGQLVGQMTLIQDLAQKQEELRVLVTKLLQNNPVGQTAKVEAPAIIQPHAGQEDKGKSPQLASGSRAQPQRGSQRKRNAPGRHFSETDIPSSFILKRLLEVNLITLKDPPKNPNRTAPRYNPDAHCAYHSDSPGHATDDCWTLKNKIQDLIDEGVIEFMPDGEMKIFRWEFSIWDDYLKLENFCSLEFFKL